MAFVNEHLTKEERAEFITKAIPNPGNELITLYPSQWTIDREKNVFLVRGAQDREEPHDYYFLLCWNGTPISVILRGSWENGSKRIWSLLSIKVPKDLKEKHDVIIQDLKEALKVYGFDGDPDWANNKITMVQCNF